MAAAYLPWWLGAAALATVALGFWRAFDRLLGVSGSVQKSLEPREQLHADRVAEALAADSAATEAAMLEATRRAFGNVVAADGPADAPLPAPRRFTYGSNVLLLLGCVLGGTLGALSHGGFSLSLTFGPVYERLLAGGWATVPVLLFGGFMVGFGTAMAGGCTSGHGLCGVSRVQRGSLLATVAFFGTGIGVTFLLLAVRR